MTERPNEPTDLELMMFADGELEDPKRAEVADFLHSSKDARLKLKAMGIVGDFVKRDAERLATAFRADDIASRVMAIIDDPVDESANGARNARVVKLAAAKNRAVTSAPHKKTSSNDRRAANDNARFIYALTAFAAAAAVALGVWSRGPGPAPLPPDRIAQANTDAPADSMLAPPSTTEHAVASVKTTEPEKQTPGVVVSRVNWGENKPGAVYYVPSDSRGSTTTVVWLASE